MKIIIALVLLFNILWADCMAQTIRNVGANDGMSGRHAFNVKQDKKGFIWIATRFGADRFDGQRIVKYPVDVLYGDVSPIRMTKLVLDRDENLWLYTDKGTIYRFNDDADAFEPFIDLKLFLRDVYFDHDNVLWFASRSFIGNVRDGHIHVMEQTRKLTPEIKKIYEYSTSQLLVLAADNLFLFGIGDGTVRPLLNKAFVDGNRMVIESCFSDTSDKSIWIGCMKNGLFRYDMQTGSLHRMSDPVLEDKPILTIQGQLSDRLILGTDGRGACIFNKITKRVETVYSKTSGNEHRISSSAVYDIYIDNDERIWLSTFTDGINILDFNKKPFDCVKFGDENSSFVCNDILESSAGNLWISTDEGIYIRSNTNGTWTQLLAAENVLSLFEDSEQRVWAGTYSSGVFVLDNSGRVLKRYDLGISSGATIGSNFVYTICEDRLGNIWFGGKKGAIVKLDKQSGLMSIVNITQANQIIPFNPNEVLVATESGIFHVDIRTNSIRPCIVNKQLKSNYVSDIYVESDNVLWLATYGDGINRCDLQTGEVVSFTEENGMPSNFIHSLLFDGSHIWFGSENGIGKLNGHSFEVMNYNLNDGLCGTIFRALSKELASDGTIYFGSYSGVTYFNPKDIEANNTKSGHLVLEDFYLFNREVKPGEPESPLVQSFDKTQHIVLKHFQHSFTVKFVAVDYNVGAHRKFRWRLEGQDRDWVGPSTENAANYTNLKPNDYVFVLQYIDKNGTVIDQRSINVSIAPPFWKTTWAYGAMTLLLLFLVYFIHWQMLQYYKRKHAQEKIDFFVNTAHDIRTPLTLINSPLSELRDSMEASEKNSYLFGTIVANIEKLNGMFSKLIDFQKVYEARERLSVAPLDACKFLEEKVAQWLPMAARKELEVNLELHDKQLLVWFDEDKMNKVMDNLLSNAIKYTLPGGEVKVKLVVEKDVWKVVVADNGIGISKNDKKHLFQRFFRARNAANSNEPGSGLGLMIVKKYVSLLHGDIVCNSTENKGTEFVLSFLYGDAHFNDHEKAVADHGPSVWVAAENERGARNSKMRLLVAEDDKNLRDYLSKTLGEEYLVETAADGEEAWQKITDFNPDILISDLQMPRLDGFGLCKRVKTTFATSHIPVIFLTVLNDAQKKETGYNLGVDDYIEKPFDVKFLRLKIGNILQNRQLLQRKFLGVDTGNYEIENELNAEFIQRVTKIIEDNISNRDFFVPDICRELGLSKSVLYAKFKTVTGYSPNDFIKVMKMKKAAVMLADKKHSINEISYILGFNEPSYFTTSFKKFYGKSPKQFIEQYKA